MSEEVDIAQLCGIRNKLYQESIRGKDYGVLLMTIGKHLKQLDNFLLQHGAIVSSKDNGGIPDEIKKPEV